MHPSLSVNIQLLSERGRQNLRSASDTTCFVPRTHNSFGDRSFSLYVQQFACRQTYD